MVAHIQVQEHLYEPVHLLSGVPSRGIFEGAVITRFAHDQIS